MVVNIKYFLNSKFKLLPLLLPFKIFLVLAGAALLITFFGPAEYDLAGLRVQVALKPSWSGQTVVALPPLGTLTMVTHHTPLKIQLTLQNIHPNVLTADFSLATLTAKDLWPHFSTATSRAIIFFVGKQLLLGALGAALALWIFRRTPLRECLKAAGAGFFVVGALFAATWATYHPEAIQEPKFDGILAFAPHALSVAEATMTELNDFHNKVTQLTNNIQHLLWKIEQMDLVQTPAASDIRLLAVADLHNNPVGVDLTLALAQHFQVSAVLDAGDLTDYGSTLELTIVHSLQQLRTPYIFAAGNHDSPAIINFIQKLPQGRALEGKIIAVNGVKILGSPDPQASRPLSARVNEDLLAKQEKELAEAMEKEGVVPDIILVHNPKVVEKFAGKVPVLIAGHTHRLEVEKIDGSLFINPGTTGAAGTRGLDAKSGVPYSAAILYFTDHQNPRLRAVDTIKYNPLSGKFSVERQVFGDKAQTIPGPSASPAIK